MESLEMKISRPRPTSLETETRSKTFETETETPRRNGSRDTSRDRDHVSRLHHWWKTTFPVELPLYCAVMSSAVGAAYTRLHRLCLF